MHLHCPLLSDSLLALKLLWVTLALVYCCQLFTFLRIDSASNLSVYLFVPSCWSSYWSIGWWCLIQFPSRKPYHSLASSVCSCYWYSETRIWTDSQWSCFDSMEAGSRRSLDWVMAAKSLKESQIGQLIIQGLSRNPVSRPNSMRVSN